MKKFLNIFEKIFICLTVFGILFASSKTFAAENNSATMKTFRETLIATSKADDRVFHESIYFIIPSIQTEFYLVGKSEGQNFKASGDFSIWGMNESGDSFEHVIPFYAAQEKADDLQIYFQDDKNWKKFNAPSLATVINDIIATPTQKDIDYMISQVKNVSILQDKPEKITMLVTLDGKKIADEIKKLSQKNPADKGTGDDKEFHETFLKYLDSALKNSDVWYVWTVDKKLNKTLAMRFNLSELVQQIALAALNDKDRKTFAGMDELLEEIAFYSETKAYTTFFNKEAEKNLEIPQDALNGKSVDDIIKD